MKIINLLPKLKQQELFYEHMFHNLLVVLWLSFSSFILVFGVQLGVKIYLQQESSQVLAESQLLKTQVSKSENEQIKKKINNLNNYINDFKSLATVPKWSKAVAAFSVLPPEEVGVSSFLFDFKNKSIAISGYAPTRQKVIDLFNNINNDTEEFFGIDYPLENVAKPTNNNFHFTFFIKDELLQ